MPADMVMKIDAAVKKMQADPEVRAENANYARMVRELNIKAD